MGIPFLTQIVRMNRADPNHAPRIDDLLLPKPDQLGCRPGLTDEPAAQRALSLTVTDRGIPLPAILTGTWMARVDDLAASPQR
jgi:hypothetical protein